MTTPFQLIIGGKRQTPTSHDHIIQLIPLALAHGYVMRNNPRKIAEIRRIIDTASACVGLPSVSHLLDNYVDAANETASEDGA